MTPRVLLIALLVCGTGCSEPKFELPTSSSESTTTTTTVPAATTQTFSGTLDVGGLRFYSFNVPSERTVSMTLEQLQRVEGDAVTAPVALGLGVPGGTGCNPTYSITATASDTPQISESLAAGIYCALVADPGTMGAAVAFLVRIDFP
jgi:hypothetical protein